MNQVWLKVLGLTIIGLIVFFAYCIKEAYKMLGQVTVISHDLWMLERDPDYPVNPYTYIFLKRKVIESELECNEQERVKTPE